MLCPASPLDGGAFNHAHDSSRFLKILRTCLCGTACLSMWLTAFAARANPSEPCTPPDAYELDVPYFCQQDDALCWAACGQMIMNYLGHNVDQCAQVDDANKRNNRITDCCHHFGEADCSEGGWPHFEDFGFTVSSNQVAMSWDKVREQIYCKHKPFAWSWCYVPCNPSDLERNIGHMFVVYGYAITNGVKELLVYNTEPACSNGSSAAPNMLTFPFDEYVNGQPDASGQLQTIHWLDMYDITWTGQVTAAGLPPTAPATTATLSSSPTAVPDTYQQASRAGTEYLAAFSKCVTDKNFRKYGFESFGEVAKVALGVPFSLYYVRLADLRAYARGSDPNSLLRDSGDLICPVLVDGNVRSAITLRKSGANWKPHGVGNAAWIRLLSDARSRSAEHPLVPFGSYFAVRMPVGANPFLVGHREGKDLILTSLVKDSRAGFRDGEDLEAENVFGALASVARSDHGIR
jgi:hypothetical protein